MIVKPLLGKLMGMRLKGSIVNSTSKSDAAECSVIWGYALHRKLATNKVSNWGLVR